MIPREYVYGRLRHVPLAHSACPTARNSPAAQRSWSATTAWRATASTAAAARFGRAARAAWKAPTCRAWASPATIRDGTRSISSRPEEATAGPVEDLLRQDRRARPRRPSPRSCATRTGAPRLIEAKAAVPFARLPRLPQDRRRRRRRRPGSDPGWARKTPGQLNFAHVPGEADAGQLALGAHPRSGRGRAGLENAGLRAHATAKSTNSPIYMLSLRRSKVPEAYLAEGPHPRRAVQGAGVRHRRRDAVRHVLLGLPRARTGKGGASPASYPFPAIANADFLAVATDEFLEETITAGRPGRRMPAWGESERRAAARGDQSESSAICGSSAA